MMPVTVQHTLMVPELHCECLSDLVILQLILSNSSSACVQMYLQKFAYGGAAPPESQKRTATKATSWHH